MSAVRGVMWALGTPVRALFIGAIRLYQVTLSGWMGGRCKYYPSCSRYAVEAIQIHGAFRGAAFATWRLLRCNPLSLGGVDHVPPGRVNPAPARPYEAVSHHGTDDLEPGRVEA